jgi:hypothetical protein
MRSARISAAVRPACTLSVAKVAVKAAVSAADLAFPGSFLDRPAECGKCATRALAVKRNGDQE